MACLEVLILSKVSSYRMDCQVAVKEVPMLQSALQSQPLSKINFHCFQCAYSVKLRFNAYKSWSMEGLSVTTAARDENSLFQSLGILLEDEIQRKSCILLVQWLGRVATRKKDAAVPTKRWYLSTKLYGVTTQATTISMKFNLSFMKSRSWSWTYSILYSATIFQIMKITTTYFT
jgi:hypothetical protein